MKAGLSFSAVRGVAAALVMVGVTEGAAAQDSVQANTPVCSLNLENNFVGYLSTVDEPANILTFRLITPIAIGGSTWTTRSTVPLTTWPVGPGLDQRTGIDTANPRATFGIGPSLTRPTATDTRLGGEKSNLGVAMFCSTPAAEFNGAICSSMSNPLLATTTKDADPMFFQPFGIYQLGDGWVL